MKTKLLEQRIKKMVSLGFPSEKTLDLEFLTQSIYAYDRLEKMEKMVDNSEKFSIQFIYHNGNEGYLGDVIVSFDGNRFEVSDVVNAKENIEIYCEIY